LAVLCLTAGLLGSAAADEAVAAAQAALPAVLARIPSGQEIAFGFHGRDEFTRASAGDPYRVMTFTLGHDGGLNLVLQRDWRVPVYVNGQACALLTMVQGERGWEAVDFGAAGLARELQHREEALSGDFPSRNRFLLRLYQHWADFLVLSDLALPADDDPAVPLFRAAAAIGFTDKAGLYPLVEVGRQVLRRTAQTGPGEE